MSEAKEMQRANLGKVVEANRKPVPTCAIARFSLQTKWTGTSGSWGYSALFKSASSSVTRYWRSLEHDTMQFLADCGTIMCAGIGRRRHRSCPVLRPMARH